MRDKRSSERQLVGNNRQEIRALDIHFIELCCEDDTRFRADRRRGENKRTTKTLPRSMMESRDEICEVVYCFCRYPHS